MGINKHKGGYRMIFILLWARSQSSNSRHVCHMVQLILVIFVQQRKWESIRKHFTVPYNIYHFAHKLLLFMFFCSWENINTLTALKMENVFRLNRMCRLSEPSLSVSIQRNNILMHLQKMFTVHHAYEWGLLPWNVKCVYKKLMATRLQWGCEMMTQF